MIESLNELSSERIIHVANAIELLVIFEKMLKLYRRPKAEYSHHRLVALTEMFISEIYEVAQKKTFSSGLSASVMRIAETIASAPLEQYNFMKVSAELKVSYTHFRRVFLDLTGYPPHKFLLIKKLRDHKTALA